MSYDININDDEFNVTGNLSLLFRTHLPNGEGINGLHGMTGKKCLKEIEGFWESFRSERSSNWKVNCAGEPEMSIKYDPTNGWGSLIGGLEFMGRLQSACVRSPRHKINVWS